MRFRLITSEAPDLSTIRVVGRLRDDAVALLGDACSEARRPLVLDLTEMMSASDAGVLLLGRLRGEGVHLLGASPYVKLLLERTVDARGKPLPRRRGPRPPSVSKAARRGRMRPHR